jgi:hypothetical protein
MTTIREEIKSVFKMITEFFGNYTGTATQPKKEEKAERKLDDATAEQGLYLGNLDGDERTTDYLANEELGHDIPPPPEAKRD